MNQIILLIFLSLGVQFQGIVWFITDPRPKQEKFQHYLKPITLIRSLILVLILILQIVNIIYFPWFFFSDNGLFTLIGLFVYFSGLILAIWAKTTMKSSWGTPAQHDMRRQNKLITMGPFRFTRNPIYLGNLLICLGFFLSLRSYLIFVFLGFYIFFYLSILKEEKLLTKYFGKKYIKYIKKVPRF